MENTSSKYQLYNCCHRVLSAEDPNRITASRYVTGNEVNLPSTAAFAFGAGANVSVGAL